VLSDVRADFCRARLRAQPLHGLAGDCGDYLEVLVKVQDREPG
jgi:hypothetical protein